MTVEERTLNKKETMRKALCIVLLLLMVTKTKCFTLVMVSNFFLISEGCPPFPQRPSRRFEDRKQHTDHYNCDSTGQPQHPDLFLYLPLENRFPKCPPLTISFGKGIPQRKRLLGHLALSLFPPCPKGGALQIS